MRFVLDKDRSPKMAFSQRREHARGIEQTSSSAAASRWTRSPGNCRGGSTMTRRWWMMCLGIVDAVSAVACASSGRDRASRDAGPSAESGSGAACDRFTDAGHRICCGRESEIPEISCVDLSKENGEFGIFGGCLPDGRAFDAKLAGAICCSGLTRTDSYEEVDGGTPGFPPGCGASGPPSIKACRPCGNRSCDTGENRCNCPADCAL